MLIILEMKKKINYLKERGSSNVNWSSIAYKFNLGRNRHNPLAIEELKRWYEEKIFNKLSFSISKETYEKRLWLCKRFGKSLIINKYLKKRKVSNSLLSWSKVKMKYLAGQYLNTYHQQEWEPVKQWYLNLSNKIMIKQRRLMIQENFEKNFSSTVLLSTENLDLGEILIDMFETFKQQVFSRESEQKIINYYQNFFETFNKNVLINTLKDNRALAKEQINGFKHVYNLNSFRNYLEKTPGLYQRLCLWAIKNPFPDESRKQKHHVFPEFLQTISEYDLSYRDLNPPSLEYNLVSVSWIIHFLFHYVRLIEYAQNQDMNALNALRITSSKKNDSSFFTLIDPYKAVGSFYINLIKDRDSGALNQLLDSEKEQIRVRNQQNQFNVINRMSDRVKNALTQDTIWRHIDEYYDDPQPSEFVFKGKSLNECSLMNLAIAINEAYNKRIEYFNLRKKPRQVKQWKFTRDLLSQYLRDKIKDQTTIHGFYWAKNRPSYIRSPESSQRFIKLLVPPLIN